MSTLDPVDDCDLVRRIATKDQGALEELFRRHRRRVMSYATRRCAQPADVADVVSATFLAVLDSAGSFDPARGAVVPWLIGIAHHQFGLMRRNDAKQLRLRQLSAAR